MSKVPGLTLADIAAQSEDVPVGDSFISVRGISAEKALAIFTRFPALAKMASGFKAADLLGATPDAIAAIIAAGIGKLGDEEQEAAAREIPLEVQFDILEAIGGLTFKNGFAPFVERVMALANAVPNLGPSIKVPDMNSPSPSKPSLPPDTPQT